MPKASIIIPTHNRLDLLQKAISSALASGDVEVIVVDDASSDGTEAYCRTLNSSNYIRLDQNVRTGGARNAGIQAANTQYLAFLDDDDVRLPGSIDRQVALMEEDAAYGVIYGRYFQADSSGNYESDEAFPRDCPEGDLLDRLLRLNFIGLSTCVVRKSVFDDIGLFDASPAMYGIEDWDLWLRAAHRHKFRALCAPVAIYRMPERGTGQWSADIQKQFGRVASAYKNKWFELPRVRGFFRDGTITKGELLAGVAERILYDMSTNSVGAREKVSKIMAVIRCQPSQLRRGRFYKSVLRAFIG